MSNTLWTIIGIAAYIYGVLLLALSPFLPRRHLGIAAYIYGVLLLAAMGYCFLQHVLGG